MKIKATQRNLKTMYLCYPDINSLVVLKISVIQKEEHFPLFIFKAKNVIRQEK